MMTLLSTINFCYQYLGNFRPGLASFRLTDDDKTDYVNTKVQPVIAAIWDMSLDFSEV
ncbi:hypothetical protein KPY62_09175 [Psychrobacter sp. TAE2020]|uniref:hypothetical protein n=1 Tax=Psychrobacter sp. TAE2020 TaxID=2846762 RepID=UPI001C116C85|nr:hypothetical protein [Psychrobacter sp. TAE2020]MBU5617254.1 hypothetical protein [Psychrobacter sp. TAE2020]